LYGTVLPRRRFFAPSEPELASLAELRETAGLFLCEDRRLGRTSIRGELVNLVDE
jgi:hypothetical protein